MDIPYVEVDLFGPSNKSPTQLDAKMTKLKHSIFLHSFFATLETIQLAWFSHKHLFWFLDMCPKKFKFIRCPCLIFLDYGLCKNIWDMFAKHWFKYIAIGTQFLEICHVSFVILVTLTNPSFLELNGLERVQQLIIEHNLFQYSFKKKGYFEHCNYCIYKLLNIPFMPCNTRLM